MDDEINRCDDCKHFSFGVCDIYGFRYEHDWVCKEKSKKERIFQQLN